MKMSPWITPHQGSHSEAFHACLKSTDRIDLGDKHDAPDGSHGVGTSLSDITVSADYSFLSSKHDISGTHDTIGQGVFATVKIVELGLGDRVIDVDGSEEERSVLFHGVKSVDTGGGFLRDTMAASGNLVPLVSLAAFQETLDDGENDLEFGVVGGDGSGRVPSFRKRSSAFFPSWMRSVISPPSSTMRSGPWPLPSSSGQVRAFNVHSQYSSRDSPFQAKTAADSSRAMAAAA